jgi:hypothetical protein
VCARCRRSTLCMSVSDVRRGEGGKGQEGDHRESLHGGSCRNRAPDGDPSREGHEQHLQGVEIGRYRPDPTGSHPALGAGPNIRTLRLLRYYHRAAEDGMSFRPIRAPRGPHRSSRALAESLRGAGDRLNPPRVPGSGPHSQSRPPAPALARRCGPLQRPASPPSARPQCSTATRRSAPCLGRVITIPQAPGSITATPARLIMVGRRAILRPPCDPPRGSQE